MSSVTLPCSLWSNSNSPQIKISLLAPSAQYLSKKEKKKSQNGLEYTWTFCFMQVRYRSHHRCCVGLRWWCNPRRAYLRGFRHSSLHHAGGHRWQGRLTVPPSAAAQRGLQLQHVGWVRGRSHHQRGEAVAGKWFNIFNNLFRKCLLRDVSTSTESLLPVPQPTEGWDFRNREGSVRPARWKHFKCESRRRWGVFAFKIKYSLFLVVNTKP